MCAVSGKELIKINDAKLDKNCVVLKGKSFFKHMTVLPWYILKIDYFVACFVEL